MKIYKGRSVAFAKQASVEKAKKYLQGALTAYSGVAKVIKVYSESNTCDIEPWRGGRRYSVPVLTRGGLIDGKVYGELQLPQEGDYVIIFFVGNNESQPVIVGTVLPYMNSLFHSSQELVNSTNKQFTKKLLEAGKNKTFKKVFPSGTTIEVKGEDGSVIVETPSGQYIEIDESAGKIVLNGVLEVTK